MLAGRRCLALINLSDPTQGERDNPWVKGIVSRDGGVAVLAGRRCLALINLSDPTQVRETTLGLKG